MGKLLYAKDGKIYANEYLEIHVPMEYFKSDILIDMGFAIETFGLLFVTPYTGGKAGSVKLLNIPTTVNIMVYDYEDNEIKIKEKTLKVRTLKYMKDSYILHQTIQKGREVAGAFLNIVLNGKLPKSISYDKTLDIWWRNLEISGVSFKVPSKIYEMILASTYRNPHNVKERYGEYYGTQINSDGFDYMTGNVRDVVEALSTFSGFAFEDINRMITNGINNSIDEVEEAVSPLEKIIYY